MLAVVVEDVGRAQRARAASARGRSPAATFSSISAMPWSPETGRAPWRLNLKPLYCARVVAGGDLHAAGGAEVADGEVVHRRGGEADVDDVEPGRAQALDQRRVRAAGCASACRGAPPPCCRCARSSASSTCWKARPILRAISSSSSVGIDAADVVGLEDSCHGRLPLDAAQLDLSSMRQSRPSTGVGSSSAPRGRRRLRCSIASVSPAIQSRWAAIAAASSASAAVADADAVGVVELRVLARRLDAGARPRAPGPRATSSGVSAVSSATSSSRSPAVAMPRFSISRTSTSSGASSTRLAVELEVDRARRARARSASASPSAASSAAFTSGIALAEALAELAEVRAAPRGGRTRCASLGPADLLDVELVPHQVGVRLDVGPTQRLVARRPGSPRRAAGGS